MSRPAVAKTPGKKQIKRGECKITIKRSNHYAITAENKIKMSVSTSGRKIAGINEKPIEVDNLEKHVVMPLTL